MKTDRPYTRTRRHGIIRPLVFVGLLGIILGCHATSTSDHISAVTEQDYYYNDQVYPYHPGWYHGALHSHALYDVGILLTPILSVVHIAEDQGFDFFVLTNHNQVFEWADAGYQSTQLTLLYGMEWTSSQGHANIWSNQPFAYYLTLPGINGGDAGTAILIAHSLSTDERPLLFSINHPDRQKNGLPSWKASYDDSKDADAIEVWNGDDIFVSSTDTFDTYLGHGRKITMVGGSDAHLKEDNDMQSFTDRLGRPTTWVYADSRSGEDILRGIEHGHVFISAAPEGPQLDFFAGNDPERIMMGDTIPADALGQELDFTVWVSNTEPPYGVVVIKNGIPQEAWSSTFATEENSFSFTDTPQTGDYYRLEVRQLASQPVAFDELLLAPVSALSNPIFT